jgi:hypothetical protein
MDLENEVHTILSQSTIALSVDEVAQELAERFKDEIRSILNTMDKKNELTSVRGSGPRYRTQYKARPIERRF